MTTYNTGNPIGSADPHDLYDNAENFDTAINALNSETWVDRRGYTRLSFYGFEQKVDQAIESLNDIISSGGQIFPDEATGRAAVEDGQYYYAESDDPDVSLIIYRRINSIISEEIASQPSVEYVRKTKDVADSSLTLASTRDQLQYEFYVTPNDDSPVFTVQGSSGSMLAFDHRGVQLQPWQGEFYSDERTNDIDYAWATRDGVVFYGLSSDGVAVAGGGVNVSTMRTENRNAYPGQGYANYEHVKLATSRDVFLGEDAHDTLTDIDTYYGMLDELMSEFPDYITKTTLGQDGLGNDILQYAFEPARYWKTSTSPSGLEKPKIVLFGCTHGNEKNGAYTNYTMLYKMCHKWREDERLARLRWGVDIILVPVVNPSGFNSTTRENHNDVDINRNYPTDWETASGKKGPSPASELETQITMQVFEDHADASAFIDHHGGGSLNGAPPFATWIGTLLDETVEVARTCCDHMMMYDRKEFSYIDQSNKPITQLSGNSDGTSMRHVQLNNGINAYLLENGSGFEPGYDKEQHALENLVNLIDRHVESHIYRKMTGEN